MRVTITCWPVTITVTIRAEHYIRKCKICGSKIVNVSLFCTDGLVFSQKWWVIDRPAFTILDDRGGVIYSSRHFQRNLRETTQRKTSLLRCCSGWIDRACSWLFSFPEMFLLKLLRKLIQTKQFCRYMKSISNKMNVYCKG